jgi:hypothetical protein
VTGLSGQVKEVVLALDQIAHAVFVSGIGDIDFDAIFNSGNVEWVAAVFWDETVYEQDFGSEVYQSAGQGRSDKAQTTGDDYFLVVENVSWIRHDYFKCLPACEVAWGASVGSVF